MMDKKGEGVLPPLLDLIQGLSIIRFVFSLYQLDLTTPGSSPLWALERSWFRQRPKSRYTPLGFPVAQQRFLILDGALFRGRAWILRCISSLCMGSFAALKAAISAERLAA